MKGEASVVIDRPVEQVFEHVVDPERLTEWVLELVEVKDISEQPIRLGTTFVHDIQALGRRFENTHKVIEYQPNSVFAFKSISETPPVEIRFEFEPVEGGTRVNISLEGETRGLLKLAGPIVNRMVMRQWETNLANLKDLLEAESVPSA